MNMEKIMDSFMKQYASQYEDLGELTEEDKAEWKRMETEANELMNKGKVLKAEGDIFWAKLERKYNRLGKTLKIDDGHVYAMKEKSLKEIMNNEEIPDPTDI